MPDLNGKIKVLLVDDNPVVASLYSKRFNSAGFDFSVISSPSDDFATEVAHINPNIIILDINFVGNKWNGAIVGEVLQLDERTKAIPIIFLTNAEDKELVERAQKLPSSIGFFVKALFLPEEIVSKVQELYNDFLKKKKV